MTDSTACAAAEKLDRSGSLGVVVCLVQPRFPEPGCRILNVLGHVFAVVGAAGGTNVVVAMQRLRICGGMQGCGCWT